MKQSTLIRAFLGLAFVAGVAQFCAQPARAQATVMPPKFSLELTGPQVDQLGVAITNGLVKRDADPLLEAILAQVREQIRAANPSSPKEETKAPEKK